MKKEVKIFAIHTEEESLCKESEEKLSTLINGGWEIITANEKVAILQKELMETSG